MSGNQTENQAEDLSLTQVSDNLTDNQPECTSATIQHKCNKWVKYNSHNNKWTDNKEDLNYDVKSKDNINEGKEI